jgi:hypothetical protein
VEDLAAYPQRSSIEEDMLCAGIRNLVIAPLYYQDVLIGMLKLGSPHPGDLHAMNAIKLREVLPLFSMAVQRSIEELNTRLQAIIKEQCTAIHPAVEWRFRQAALRLTQQRREGTPTEMEPIVFEGVYPMYGVSDIRDSSLHRNAAIQGDLADHLRLAQEILLLAHSFKPLPILDELAYHVGSYIAQIESALGSGDEIAVLEFLHREVEPFFEHIRTFDTEVHDKIQTYSESLDPHLRTLYRRRKDFEESVTLLNETLSAFLDTEQERAQAMFPHYFEKHKTDGVEYGMYIGASLTEQKKFDALYLHNLRLWQLLVMCRMVREAEALKDRLKVPLDTAHLILVQHSPLSIRFRFDEKRFDVDGTYNMHYEIVKKRIDKALIKGTLERLTQPGKIAIVYSQPKEAQEYHDYIAYLQACGYLTAEIEEVEVEDLQGVPGLKALRVTVDMQHAWPTRGESRALPWTDFRPVTWVGQHSG